MLGIADGMDKCLYIGIADGMDRWLYIGESGLMRTGRVYSHAAGTSMEPSVPDHENLFVCLGMVVSVLHTRHSQ